MSELLTLAEFARAYPSFTESALRFQLTQRHSNGIEQSGAIVRRGYHVLIDPPKFFAWLRTRPGLGQDAERREIRATVDV